MGENGQGAEQSAPQPEDVYWADDKKYSGLLEEE